MTSALPDPSDLLEHALAYLDCGWSILPIGHGDKSKKPAVKWKPYQTRQPSENELREWFKMSNLAGMAVVLGPVSCDLYCRDFDLVDSYDHWAREHPELAKSLPTALSKRGQHVYFRSLETIHTKAYDDGELRGIGSYCILPPSIHQSGHLYKWLIPLPRTPLLVVDSRESGFCQNWNGTNKGEIKESPVCTESTERTEEDRAHRRTTASVHSVPPLGLDVDKVVTLALPTDKHKSNKLLFLLARAVKALEKRRGREFSETELFGVFDLWYRRATPFLRKDQSRDEYLFEFLYGFGRVKHPLGEEAITLAWTLAKKSAPPKIAEQFQQKEIRLLVALCCELQRIAGDDPFYLACRTVARLFHHDTHTTAARWLRGLCLSKVIRVTQKGGPETNKASRYRYLHPLDE